MNSQDPARHEDQPGLNEEVTPKQESSSGLLQGEPEPPHATADQEDPLGRPEEPAAKSAVVDDASSPGPEGEPESDAEDTAETSGGGGGGGGSVPKVAKTYVCKLCNRTFSRTKYFKRHNVIHTGEKPYQCKTCDMTFNRVEHLKRHQTVHTGERPYRCKHCDCCFNHPNGLKRHQRIHKGKNL